MPSPETQPGQIKVWEERYGVHSRIFAFLERARAIEAGRESPLGRRLDTLSQWIRHRIQIQYPETKSEFLTEAVSVKQEALNFLRTGDPLSKLFQLAADTASEIEKLEKAN